MNGRLLLDSNVLLYAYDRSEPVKQRRAVEVLDALALAGGGLVSAQILGEFFVVATRKLSSPLSLEDASRSVAQHLDVWTVLDVTGETVQEAVRGVRKHRLSYWDAQIWATARLNGVGVVLRGFQRRCAP